MRIFVMVAKLQELFSLSRNVWTIVGSMFAIAISGGFFFGQHLQEDRLLEKEVLSHFENHKTEYEKTEEALAYLNEVAAQSQARLEVLWADYRDLAKELRQISTLQRKRVSDVYGIRSSPPSGAG
jgi:hypothetical protein